MYCLIMVITFASLTSFRGEILLNKHMHVAQLVLNMLLVAVFLLRSARHIGSLSNINLCRDRSVSKLLIVTCKLLGN